MPINLGDPNSLNRQFQERTRWYSSYSRRNVTGNEKPVASV